MNPLVYGATSSRGHLVAKQLLAAGYGMQLLTRNLAKTIKNEQTQVAQRDMAGLSSLEAVKIPVKLTTLERRAREHGQAFR